MITYVGNFTAAMKNYTEEKLGKLTNRGIDISNTRVKLTILPNEKLVEISIDNKIRASEKGEDFYNLVVDVVGKISSQYSRFKSYRKSIEFPVEGMAPEIEDKIVKEKIFFLNEMTDEEAIENMELLGHSFYVYQDIDRGGRTCIIYKRENETYGIIECR